MSIQEARQHIDHFHVKDDQDVEISSYLGLYVMVTSEPDTFFLVLIKSKCYFYHHSTCVHMHESICVCVYNSSQLATADFYRL